MAHQPPSKRFAIVAALAAVALVGVVAACGGGSNSSSAGGSTGTTETTKVTFMLPIPVRSTATFPFNVAEAAGLYKEEGLDVTIQTAQSAAFAIQQMAAGKVDFALSTAGAAVNAFAQGQPVKSVCELFQGQVFSVWVPQESAIRSFADLKGKKIGVESLQGGHVPELKAFLAAENMSPGRDVTLVPLGDDAATVVEAFKRNRVDAFDLSFARNPGPRLALKLRPVPAPQQLGQTAQEPILARTSLVENQPEVVTRFLRATAKAIVFGNANPDAVYAIQKKVFPPEYESMPFAELLLKTSIQTMAGSATLDPEQTFCRMSEAGWTQLMNELVVPGEPGALQKKFDVTAGVDNSFVDGVNDFDRQAVIDAAKNYKVANG